MRLDPRRNVHLPMQRLSFLFRTLGSPSSLPHGLGLGLEKEAAEAQIGAARVSNSLDDTIACRIRVKSGSQLTQFSFLSQMDVPAAERFGVSTRSRVCPFALIVCNATRALLWRSCGSIRAMRV